MNNSDDREGTSSGQGGIYFDPRHWYTSKQLEKAFRISDKTVASWIPLGLRPTDNEALGMKTRLFRGAEINKFLEDHIVKEA